MPRSNRTQPMPVKYWTFAGLILTDWCNAQCASCYLRCGPGGRGQMSVQSALGVWQSLIDASPTGCRIHLSGGEPFGDWNRLAEICFQAHQRGLRPLQKVETNAFWALDDNIVRQRLEFLDAAGMGKLAIAADPYHQQFVPIERCRRAARVAREVLGADRVLVRWEDWLANGQDTADLTPEERAELFAQYGSLGRDRHNGRGAGLAAFSRPLRPIQTLADNPCAGALLRSGHVHVNYDGGVIPGVCAGILAGRWPEQSMAEIWSCLDGDYADRPILGRLAAGGPARLLELAREHDFKPLDAYADKCHLCWDIRSYLAGKGLYPRELGSSRLYGE